MKSMKEVLHENNMVIGGVTSNILNEGFLDNVVKGYHQAMDAGSKAFYKVVPRENLPQPSINIHMNGVDVNRLNASHTSHYHVHAHFQPTHSIKVNIPGSTHAHGTSAIYVVGNELGSHGPQVYRKDHTGSYTKVSHIRLIHENPDIMRTHVGQQIYHSNSAIFKALPITATRGDIRRVMSMNPADKIQGHSVKELQKIAMEHPNSSPAVVTHLLNNPHLDQMVLQKAVIKHGLTKQQAQKLLSHPNVSHSILRDAATNVLANP